MSRPRSRGRGPVSKRWIYWRRRYANPTRRDWLLLIVLLWILLSVGLSFLSFRLGGTVLGACPLTLAVLRCSPGPLGTLWVNRSRTIDVVTLVVFGVCLVGLALVVPPRWWT